MLTIFKCPCVTPPGTDKCIVYDPRYAAVSPEEAAVAFTDLTADNFDTSPFVSSFLLSLIVLKLEQNFEKKLNSLNLNAVFL